MIQLKKIDVCGQIALIIFSVVLLLWLREEVILLCYISVGGWQVLSTLIQVWSNKKQPELKERDRYQVFLMIAALTLPIGSFWILPLIAPFSAIWYLSISYRELRIWEKRKFIQLR